MRSDINKEPHKETRARGANAQDSDDTSRTREVLSQLDIPSEDMEWIAMRVLKEGRDPQKLVDRVRNWPNRRKSDSAASHAVLNGWDEWRDPEAKITQGMAGSVRFEAIQEMKAIADRRRERARQSLPIGNFRYDDQGLRVVVGEVDKGIIPWTDDWIDEILDDLLKQ